MAEIKVKLRPFTVPNFVIVCSPPGKRQDGFHEAPSIPLCDLDDATLIQLCDEFKVAVLEKAKRDRLAKFNRL